MTWDKAGLENEVRNYESATVINWSQLAVKYGVKDSKGMQYITKFKLQFIYLPTKHGMLSMALIFSLRSGKTLSHNSLFTFNKLWLDGRFKLASLLTILSSFLE